MATTTKLASAAEVRAWAETKGFTTGARGRLSAEVIAAFNKAHRSRKYVAPSAR